MIHDQYPKNAASIKSKRGSSLSSITSEREHEPSLSSSSSSSIVQMEVGANGCKQEISENDPSQNQAIQCCHQNEQFQWIDYEDNCSRWLCNFCRIKLSIEIESIWFCDDHADMHLEDDGDDKFD
ncbi:unnamed protein product [Rotaria magnacalcarata]|uniref:Uncharacterized protein n=2 Tax=Rotaria magnacalcarata TaxID=392030 RepID=A0A8S2P972_9BILA|nr:unnamed protein product [Rotaria magnacalcarata]